MPYARQPDKRKTTSGLVLRTLVASGEVVARNPAIAGGTTAFLVSLFFVSANAMWYQPHFHKGAFFATRLSLRSAAAAPATPSPARRPAAATEPKAVPTPLPRDNETTGAIADTEAQAKADESAGANGDGTIWQVQSVLNKLGLYDGAIDGLSGPQTRAAIENYQKIVGIDASGDVNDDVLRHLGIKSDTRASVPHPTPRPVRQAAVEDSVSQSVKTQASPDEAAEGDPRVVKIQAGLKAFGNDGIRLDGVVGEDTRSALKEFQSLFGLPVTGKPDAKVAAKMKDIGLIN